ncbi:budded virus/occlusion-derived virus structural protein [Adoxophyes honmai nucleopolyhedrovirus]|uniref:Budded virus/occlusion-derived virus structural protein n=1 Tax=Adoxophyes honmai nucleopolyhedrovirus TaxID=224399 RepID=Q80LL9_NPVAH|nr:budded virus/occlusion-derived virus structural protein [Adoxophyes honmai nucleopolyhedrovirus]BAC67328.1 budded virus/occlusion-derived virus structural protein [Adoxophyes honmai nucleopolyhedrovirus]
MSEVMLFLEIEKLKNKIDKEMQMDIWPKFFPLLSNPNATLNLSMQDLFEFLENTARHAALHNDTDSAALASGLLSNRPVTNDDNDTTTQHQRRRNLLNFKTLRNSNDKTLVNIQNLNEYRKRCIKVLQYYTMRNTTTVDFKINDIVTAMIYLAITPKYKPLYVYLEGVMFSETDCAPVITEELAHNLINLLRSIMDMPTTTVDAETVKLLRITLNKTMNYPVARYPRVLVTLNSSLNQDKRRTLEELIIDRMECIQRLEPTQVVTNMDTNKIPYCDDMDFMTELYDMIGQFPVPRMFYNAANSMFYNTMENYAIANCKFNVEDFNNIFKISTCAKEIEEKIKQTTDSLNIYLGNNLLSKRRKYT